MLYKNFFLLACMSRRAFSAFKSIFLVNNKSISSAEDRGILVFFCYLFIVPFALVVQRILSSRLLSDMSRICLANQSCRNIAENFHIAPLSILLCRPYSRVTTIAIVRLRVEDKMNIEISYLSLEYNLNLMILGVSIARPQICTNM